VARRARSAAVPASRVAAGTVRTRGEQARRRAADAGAPLPLFWAQLGAPVRRQSGSRGAWGGIVVVVTA
jgi:hypothetical protein